MSRNRVLLAVAFATALCALVLTLAGTGHVWLRVIFGIPLVLLLPGQAATLLCDPEGRLGGLEWFALSAGASIASTILAGMGLAATFGLTAERTVVALAAVTLLTLMVAARRQASEPGPVVVRHAPVLRMATGALALLACALLVLLLSIPRATTSGPGTVQLWGLPSTSGSLRIGTRNVDAESRHYRLTIEQGGRIITQREVDMPSNAERIFEVKASATWTKSAPVTAELADESGILPARTVSVWPAQ